MLLTAHRIMSSAPFTTAIPQTHSPQIPMRLQLVCGLAILAVIRALVGALKP
jgi:hypothetical protein